MSVQNGQFTRTESFMPQRDSIMPRFYLESIEDQVASAREGRPIFRDQERVELLIPGNTLNVKVDIVTDEHRQRWPEQYKRFKDGMEISANGTPLEQWPILKPAQVRELKALNLFTVEHVRDMTDQTCQQMRIGGMKMRTLAAAYLDDAAAGAALAKATADNERKDSELAELRGKVEQLSTLLNSVHADMQALRNAPSPIASHIPSSVDPMELFKQGQQIAAGESSLDNLPAPRQRNKNAAQAR